MNVHASLFVITSIFLTGCNVKPDLIGVWGWSDSGGCDKDAPRLIVTEESVMWSNPDGKSGEGGNAATNYYMESGGMGRFKSATLEYDAGKYRIVDHFEIKWSFGSPTYRLVSRYGNKRKVRDAAIQHLNASLVSCN